MEAPGFACFFCSRFGVPGWGFRAFRVLGLACLFSVLKAKACGFCLVLGFARSLSKCLALESAGVQAVNFVIAG